MEKWAEFQLRDMVSSDADFKTYRAISPRDAAPVLVKVAANSWAEGAIRPYLQHEASLAAMLDQPWAVRPRRLEQTPAGPAIVLDDPGGTPLSALLAPMEIGEFITLAVALAQAVGAMHAQGWIHGDLRPQNIFLASSGGALSPKLSGFVLARPAPNRPDDTPEIAPPPLDGALPYLAPEQTRRVSLEVDQRSDLYALGMILYPILAGAPAYAGKDALDWVHFHVSLTPQTPAERRPSVPQVLSDLVMRLVAKDPRDRYLNASALLADLEKCATLWRTTGRLAAFDLGAGDPVARIIRCTTLVGRGRELDRIRTAWRQMVATGHPEVLLVAGTPGVGKTSLIQRALSAAGGPRYELLEGKFDQAHRGIPYETMTRALHRSVEGILAGDPEKIPEWRARILEAVGAYGQRLLALVPLLQSVVGPQPDMPELPPGEAEKLFHKLLLRFLQVFATGERPLVLFLDDLQWADAASLAFVRSLLRSTELRHVFLVGAYRDNEVDATHPLAVVLAEQRAEGRTVPELRLAPLIIEDLHELVSELFGTQGLTAFQLAEVLHQKTAGNPLYARQFLHHLVSEGIVHHDAHTRTWCWDIHEVSTQTSAENVTQLLSESIAKLPDTARRLLALGACCGFEVDAALLAGVSETPHSEVLASMQPAVSGGFVTLRDGRVHFVHDRVQQAALCLLSPSEQKRIRLRIARLYSALPAGEALLFDLVSHYRAARELLTAPAERLRVARFSLAAAQKAKASSAPQSGFEYGSLGVAMLPETAWDEEYELAIELHVVRAECAWRSGAAGDAEGYFSDLLATGRIKELDRMRIYRILVEVNTTQGKMRQALIQCQRALAVLGIDFAVEPTHEQVMEVYRQFRAALKDRAIESLVDLPPIADPIEKAALDAMAAALPAAIFTSSNAGSYLYCKMVNSSIAHGNGDAAAAAYAYFAMILGSVFGEYQEAYRLGRVAHELAQRDTCAWKARIDVIFGNVVNFWTKPMRTNIPYVRAALPAAQEVGDLAGACYSCNHLISVLLAAGQPLPDVHAEVERCLEFVRGMNYPDITDILIGQQRLIHALQGKTKLFSNSVEDDFDERAFAARIAGSQMTLLKFWYQTWRLQACYLMGHLEEALAAGAAARPLLWSSPGHVEEAEHHFYHALALASACSQATDAERDEALRQLDDYRRTFARWTANCPENFAHKRRLLDAEWARLAGQTVEAEMAYEDAIRWAGNSDFVQVQAIAFERASRFYGDRNLPMIRDLYGVEARMAYQRWGAHGKVRQLEEQAMALRQLPVGAAGAASVARAWAGPVDESDMLAQVQAIQAISGETDQEQLVSKLLEIVAKSAGADKAILIRLKEDSTGWRAVAQYLALGGRAQFSWRYAEPHDFALATRVVNLVIQSGSSVILREKGAPGETLWDDPYLCSSDAKSVLAVPIVQKGRCIGAIYCENSAMVGTFTAARLNFIESLALQSAISLQNVDLIANLRAENAARRRSEEALSQLNLELDQRVQERTAELEAFVYCVSHDLRAPLWRIKNFSQFLAEDAGPRLDEEDRRRVGLIGANIQKMEALICGLLDLSRASRGAWHPEWTDMTSLVEETLRDVLAEQPTESPPWDLHIGALPPALADRNLMRQVWVNLIANAVKFSSKASARRLEIGSRPAPEGTVYFVKDSGVGFSPEDSERIFGIFERLHGDAEFPGSGIGLSIVSRIVRRHGGKVWAEGQRGQGATFYFLLSGDAHAVPRARATISA